MARIGEDRGGGEVGRGHRNAYRLASQPTNWLAGSRGEWNENARWPAMHYVRTDMCLHRPAVTGAKKDKTTCMHAYYVRVRSTFLGSS